MHQLSPARTMELIQTVNSPGWLIAMEMAEAGVQQAEEAVWACKDRTQRDDLVLKAQAAREFLSYFKQSVESARSATGATQHFPFAEVSCD